MTAKEECAAAWDEIMKVGLWLNEETKRIIDELQREQGEEYRIDDPRNRAAFKKVRAEFARRMKAIGEKYDLPPDTKIKLW